MPLPSASQERSFVSRIAAQVVLAGAMVLGGAACKQEAFVTEQELVGQSQPELSLSVPNLQPMVEAVRQVEEGRRIFRYDTFGDEEFWGDKLKLHQLIAGAANGGVGAGVSPAAALSLGLKVDVEALPLALRAQIRAGQVDLNDPKTTLALLRLNAVIGLTGFFNADQSIRSLGVQCALCHTQVDDSFAPGIGRRLDGWPNRDLNIGAIIASAPDLSALTSLLQVSEADVKTVLLAWGPGKFDASLVLDGKGFRPDGKSAAQLFPSLFNLGGVNQHTYQGWGSLTYWNAFVATLEMFGKGSFSDTRLNDAAKFPVAARAGFARVRNTPDLVTSKLPALEAYQLALRAPPAPAGSYDPAAAARGKALFEGRARCSGCHVPPLYTEPGQNLHLPSTIGIDDFQANRGPEGKYRTTPLRGLWTRQKGGFFHDGRFATLADVVNHFDTRFNLALQPDEKTDLVEFLKTL